MSAKVLTAEHFVEGNPFNILSLDWGQIEFVKCFHATRLPDIEAVLREGLRLPTQDSVTKLLKAAGLDDIDSRVLHEVLIWKRQHVWLQLNRVLISHCDYHLRGPEIIRTYLNAACPEQWVPLKSRIAFWTPCLLQLKIPISYFEDDDDFWHDIHGYPKELLREHVSEVDICLECRTNIPAVFIEEVISMDEI